MSEEERKAEEHHIREGRINDCCDRSLQEERMADAPNQKDSLTLHAADTTAGRRKVKAGERLSRQDEFHSMTTR